jgi:hypothetical protein
MATQGKPHDGVITFTVKADKIKDATRTLLATELDHPFEITVNLKDIPQEVWHSMLDTGDRPGYQKLGGLMPQLNGPPCIHCGNKELGQ